MCRSFGCKKKGVVEYSAWSQFRGPNRDGTVAWLPEKLPDQLQPAWIVDLPSGGIGGLVADSKYVVVGSRDLSDQGDLFECYKADDGQLIWAALTAARGKLDYGNSPRATPMLFDGLVFTIGAFGDVQALDLETGAKLWHKHMIQDLHGRRPEWGYTASPLIVDDQLIVQPGGDRCALAALDLITGESLWQAAGEKAVYASLVLDDSPVGRSLIGLDSQGVCGWSLDGQLRWRRKPNVAGDFGVPTPVHSRHGLVLTSENNGTRLYGRDNSGEFTADSTANLAQIAPNSHSPVAVGNRLLISHNHLYCLDLSDGLKQLWRVRDHDLRGYASIIASEERALVLTENGTLMLLSTATGEVISKLPLVDEPLRVLAHPAIVGDRLYVRLDRKLICIKL